MSESIFQGKNDSRLKSLSGLKKTAQKKVLKGLLDL
jgi:hypothetical protein